ncbi:SRSO17 transposase [Bradyrhizobium sp. USDA 4486]
MPTTTPVCLSLTVFIFRRNGLRTAIGGARWGIPAEVGFQTKLEIALEQLRWACASGLPRGVVLMDAGYGNNSDLPTEITALGLTYVAGLLSSTTVWAPGTGPLPPKPWSGRGRPPKLMGRNRQDQPSRRQGARDRPAGRSLAHHHVPARNGRKADLALCPRAGPGRAS